LWFFIERKISTLGFLRLYAERLKNAVLEERQKSHHAPLRVDHDHLRVVEQPHRRRDRDLLPVTTFSDSREEQQEQKQPADTSFVSSPTQNYDAAERSTVYTPDARIKEVEPTPPLQQILYCILRRRRTEEEGKDEPPSDAPIPVPAPTPASALPPTNAPSTTSLKINEDLDLDLDDELLVLPRGQKCLTFPREKLPVTKMAVSTKNLKTGSASEQLALIGQKIYYGRSNSVEKNFAHVLSVISDNRDVPELAEVIKRCPKLPLILAHVLVLRLGFFVHEVSWISKMTEWSYNDCRWVGRSMATLMRCVPFVRSRFRPFANMLSLEWYKLGH